MLRAMCLYIFKDCECLPMAATVLTVGWHRDVAMCCDLSPEAWLESFQIQGLLISSLIWPKGQIHSSPLPPYSTCVWEAGEMMFCFSLGWLYRLFFCGWYFNLHRVISVLKCGSSVLILGCPELTFGWRFGGVSLVEKTLFPFSKKELNLGLLQEWL